MAGHGNQKFPYAHQASSAFDGFAGVLLLGFRNINN